MDKPSFRAMSGLDSGERLHKMPSQRTDKSMEGQRRVLGGSNIYQQGRGDSAQQVEKETKDRGRQTVAFWDQC